MTSECDACGADVPIDAGATLAMSGFGAGGSTTVTLCDGCAEDVEAVLEGDDAE